MFARTISLHRRITDHRRAAVALLPGVALCCVVAAAALAVEAGENALLGKAWLEALVIAILLGTAIRSAWAPGDRWCAGITFSGKSLLEIAVVLLGASVSARTLLAVGPALLWGIAGVVALAIPLSFAIGRLLGLSTRMALLVACGNSICGNSAIAAVAPVIDADSDDVAAAIAFTAILGVVVILGLPLLGIALGMGVVAYGALAGLTVYAVPQVIAATAPLGATAIHVGTLVKLVRVLMLGPVCLVLSLAMLRSSGSAARGGARWPRPTQLVPWFILGFLALIAGRSLGMIPAVAVAPIGHIATLLTVVSMAALGLGVDIRAVAGAGVRVTAAVCLSLLALAAISFALIGWLHLA